MRFEGLYRRTVVSLTFGRGNGADAHGRSASPTSMMWMPIESNRGAAKSDVRHRGVSESRVAVAKMLIGFSRPHLKVWVGLAYRRVAENSDSTSSSTGRNFHHADSIAYRPGRPCGCRTACGPGTGTKCAQESCRVVADVQPGSGGPVV